MSQKTTLNQRAFVVAFIPQPSQSNVAKLWSIQASEALKTIVDFRSACNRWDALGEIVAAELVEQIEALDRAGMRDFTDEMIALGTVTNYQPELNGGER